MKVTLQTGLFKVLHTHHHFTSLAQLAGIACCKQHKPGWKWSMIKLLPRPLLLQTEQLYYQSSLGHHPATFCVKKCQTDFMAARFCQLLLANIQLKTEQSQLWNYPVTVWVLVMKFAQNINKILNVIRLLFH